MKSRSPSGEPPEPEAPKIDVFNGLVALQRHHEHVADDPRAWMPWNYAVALDQIAGRDPPN